MTNEEVARAGYAAWAATREDEFPAWEELDQGERDYYVAYVRRWAPKVKQFGPHVLDAEAALEERENYTEERRLLVRTLAGVMWAYGL